MSPLTPLRWIWRHLTDIVVILTAYIMLLLAAAGCRASEPIRVKLLRDAGGKIMIFPIPDEPKRLKPWEADQADA